MSARLTAVLDFVGSKFTAGIERAKLQAASLGTGFARVAGVTKKFFAGMGGVGGLFGLGAISQLFSRAADMAETAFARMDFSKISRKNAASIIAAKNDFKSLFDSIVAGAARGFGAIGDFFRRGGSFWGSILGGDSVADALKSANAVVNATEEEIAVEAERERNFAKYTKNIASGYDIMAKRAEDAAKAEKKRVEELTKAEEDQQAGADKAAAENEKGFLGLRSAALSPSTRKQLAAEAKNAARENSRFARLLNRAIEKQQRLEFRGGQGPRLTESERFALLAQRKEQGGAAGGLGALVDYAKSTEAHTKDIADTIAAAINLGG